MDMKLFKKKEKNQEKEDKKIDCPYCGDGHKLNKVFLGGVYYCSQCFGVYDRHFNPTKRTRQMLDERELQKYHQENANGMKVR